MTAPYKHTVDAALQFEWCGTVFQTLGFLINLPGEIFGSDVVVQKFCRMCVIKTNGFGLVCPIRHKRAQLMVGSAAASGY